MTVRDVRYLMDRIMQDACLLHLTNCMPHVIVYGSGEVTMFYRWTSMKAERLYQDLLSKYIELLKYEYETSIQSSLQSRETVV